MSVFDFITGLRAGQHGACAAALTLSVLGAWQASPQPAADATAQAPPPNEPADAPADTPRAVPAPAEPVPERSPRRVGFTQQIGLVTELATSYRIRDELDQLLTSNGRAVVGAGPSPGARLAGIATRCEVLANSAEFDQARAVLLTCQARANAALAQLDAGGSEQARLRRLHQVRAAAEQLRDLDTADAHAAADYWQLLADLADAEPLVESVSARQALAENLIQGYVQRYADADAGREYVLDARLSWAMLLDQRGDQESVEEQLEAIGQLPADSPRQEQAQRLRASAARIGQPIDFEAVSTRLEMWRLSDHAGKPVLLHIYADSAAPSVAMIEQIKRAIAARALGGCTVASLRVGEPVVGTPTPPWPTLPIDLEPGGVLDRLGIDALPTLVWIDTRGRVASIGSSLAVLDRVPTAGPAADDADASEVPGRQGESPPADAVPRPAAEARERGGSGDGAGLAPEKE